MKLLEFELSDVDPRIVNQLQSAEAMLAQNPDYALQLCKHLLVSYPGCLPIRKLLRKAQQENDADHYLRAHFYALWARSVIKKNPAKTLILAEKSISESPKRPLAYMILAQACECLGLLKTAVHSHDELERLSPGYEDHELSHASILLQMDKPDLAIKKIEAILQQTPDHVEAKNLLKRATVASLKAPSVHLPR